METQATDTEACSEATCWDRGPIVWKSHVVATAADHQNDVLVSESEKEIHDKEQLGAINHEQTKKLTDTHGRLLHRLSLITRQISSERYTSTWQESQKALTENVKVDAGLHLHENIDLLGSISGIQIHSSSEKSNTETQEDKLIRGSIQDHAFTLSESPASQANQKPHYKFCIEGNFRADFSERVERLLRTNGMSSVFLALSRYIAVCKQVEAYLFSLRLKYRNVLRIVSSDMEENRLVFCSKGKGPYPEPKFMAEWRLKLSDNMHLTHEISFGAHRECHSSFFEPPSQRFFRLLAESKGLKCALETVCLLMLRSNSQGNLL